MKSQLFSSVVRKKNQCDDFFFVVVSFPCHLVKNIANLQCVCRAPSKPLLFFTACLLHRVNLECVCKTASNTL